MSRLLVIKTGALGDVLRTTSILPGLAVRSEELSVTWVTAHSARELVEHHRLVDVVEGVSPSDVHEIGLLADKLAAEPWDRVLSFDDEAAMCKLASAMPLAAGGVLSGAYLDEAGERAYTDDVAPWFDMGLISRFGKEEADRRKKENTETHPAIFARMLGVEPGRPELPLTAAARRFAADFAEGFELDLRRPLVGLNTGAGGRWRTKGISEEYTVDLVRQVSAATGGEASFLILGGPEERDRNRRILTTLHTTMPEVKAIDARTDNSLLEFAALVKCTDVLVASDSLALHLGIAMGRKIVCFFAPTSAAEIELYGLGEKVCSSAPDYCSYRPDADNSTITPERLCAGILEVLGR